MTDLNFASLNKAAGREDWCDTFAYWIGILYEPKHQFAQNAEEAYYTMSFQFDVEEQAQNQEMLIGDAEIIPNVFKPVAPVTVALRWSPFPAVIEMLGPPLHLDTQRGHTLGVFSPLPVSEVTGRSADEKHFSFLLKHACELATTNSASVLLVGSPGWSYDEEMESIEDIEDVRKLMRDFGFIYTLRKPAAI